MPHGGAWSCAGGHEDFHPTGVVSVSLERLAWSEFHAIDASPIVLGLQRVILQLNWRGSGMVRFADFDDNEPHDFRAGVGDRVRISTFRE